MNWVIFRISGPCNLIKRAYQISLLCKAIRRSKGKAISNKLPEIYDPQMKIFTSIQKIEKEAVRII